MTTTLPLDDSDVITIVKYKTALHKQEGYHGPIFISITRLTEIHMPAAELIAQAAINKAKGYKIMTTAIIEKVTLFCDACEQKFELEASEYIGNPDEVFATFVTDLAYDTRCPHCKNHIAFILPSRTDDMRKREPRQS